MMIEEDPLSQNPFIRKQRSRRNQSRAIVERVEDHVVPSRGVIVEEYITDIPVTRVYHKKVMIGRRGLFRRPVYEWKESRREHFHIQERHFASAPTLRMAIEKHTVIRLLRSIDPD